MPRPADLGLVLLAAAVTAAAVHVVTRDPGPPPSTTLAAAAPSATPAALPSDSPSAAPMPTAVVSSPRPLSSLAGPVLLVGHDLDVWQTPMVALGWEVLTARAGKDTVLAAGALAAVKGSPAFVVLEVLPGTRTTPRSEEAVRQVRARFPQAVVVLVGPFDPMAARSTQAVRAAATREHVLFLDPVAEHWSRAGDPTQMAKVLASRLLAA
jgi:hypothetical protein